MTRAERFRGALYETPAGALFVIRAIDPRTDLAAALRAAHRPGTPTKVRRGWSILGGQLQLSFEILEPESCRRRAFYVPPAGLDAFLRGCAVGLDTRPSGRKGGNGLPVWPAEAPRLDVVEAMWAWSVSAPESAAFQFLGSHRLTTCRTCRLVVGDRIDPGESLADGETKC
jgi:hypothetical protein